VSHQITQPYVARWAEWYLIELTTSGVLALVAAFYPVVLPLVLIPLAVIAAREAYRLACNARVRLAGKRRDRAEEVA